MADSSRPADFPADNLVLKSVLTPDARCGVGSCVKPIRRQSQLSVVVHSRIIGPCDTTAWSSGLRARRTVTSCRSRTVVLITAVRSAAPTWTSLSESVRSRRCWKTLPWPKSRLPDTRRVFLADGNALVLDTERLVAILDALTSGFPRLRRVGIYANARDILGKTDADLAVLRQRKLEIVYLGLESGSDEVLRRIRKGITAAEMVEAVHKLKRAGMRASVIAILGLGGTELSASARRRNGACRQCDGSGVSLHAHPDARSRHRTAPTVAVGHVRVAGTGGPAP